MEGDVPLPGAVLEAIDAATEAKDFASGMCSLVVLNNLSSAGEMIQSESSGDEVKAWWDAQVDLSRDGSIEEGSSNICLGDVPVQEGGNGQDDSERRVFDNWGEGVAIVDSKDLCLALSTDSDLA